MGRLVKLPRRRDLVETASIHHADPPRDRHRLFLVVSDDDEGHAEPPLQLHQFELRAFAQLLVERGQRLVEQQNPRAARQRARQRHALLLTAGELIGLALLEAFELDQRHHLGHAGIDLRTRHARALQPECDVVPHVEMGKQRVVLKHHVDRTLVRQDLRDVLAVQQDAPLIRRLESGKHPQQRGLAATTGAEQREKLAGLMSSDSRSTARKTPNFFTTASMRSSGMSALASGPDFAEPASASISDNSSVMLSACPNRRRTLTADRHRLNHISGRGHNIIAST